MEIPIHGAGDAEEGLEPGPVSDPSATAAEERLRRSLAQLSGERALLNLCRHVVSDRTYADSTRAIFAELLEQVRSGIGRG